MARATTTPAATVQSSPMMKSYQKAKKLVMYCISVRPRRRSHWNATLTAQRRDHCERPNEHNDQYAKNCGVTARPLDAGAFSSPKGPEGRKQGAGREFHRIFGHLGERLVQKHTGKPYEEDCDSSAQCSQRYAPLRAAKREHDERHFKTFE